MGLREGMLRLFLSLAPFEAPCSWSGYQIRHRERLFFDMYLRLGTDHTGANRFPVALFGHRNQSALDSVHACGVSASQLSVAHQPMTASKANTWETFS